MERTGVARRLSNRQPVLLSEVEHQQQREQDASSTLEKFSESDDVKRTRMTQRHDGPRGAAGVERADTCPTKPRGGAQFRAKQRDELAITKKC